MAKLNLDYYKGEDLYSDGDVEEEILEIIRSGRNFDEIDEVKFPSFTTSRRFVRTF